MFNVQLYVYILWQHQYNSKNNSYLSGTYYIEDIEGIIQTTERTGTIISHKGFPLQPYGRRISASLRITGLKPNVVATVLFVKFSSKFDVSTSDTRKDCQVPADDILYIGDESSPRTYSGYCNNGRPALDVWIPHGVDSDRFIFQLVLSSSLPSTKSAVGFHLEYSGGYKAYFVSPLYLKPLTQYNWNWNCKRSKTLFTILFYCLTVLYNWVMIITIKNCCGYRNSKGF